MPLGIVSPSTNQCEFVKPFQHTGLLTLCRSPATECSVLAKYMTAQDRANAQTCPPERGILQEPYPQVDSVSVPVLPGE